MLKSSTFVSILGLVGAASVALGQGTAVHAPAGGKLGPAASVASPVSVQEKAAKIILPKVEFSGATLREAIDFLRLKSSQLDPEKTGVNIIQGSPGNPETRLSLNLTNIPLSEALKYVASLGGLKASAIPYAFIFEDPTTNDTGWIPAAIKPGSPEEALMVRSMAMIIPTVNFNSASMDEAVEFIRKKSATLSPDGKALNILVKGTNSSADARLTLSMNNVPLPVLLQYVAGMAGLKQVVKPGIFYICPWTENTD